MTISDPMDVAVMKPAQATDAACRALLFDFGSVISVSLFEQHRRTERHLGLPAGSLTWLGAVDPSTDPLWQDMLADRLSERDYWARRADQIGQACGEQGWIMATLLGRLRHDDPDAAVRPEAAALIRDAKAAGYKIGLLSNELELFYGRAFVERLAIRPLFDGWVDATHTKILKPDPRAYAQACDALQLPAHQVLFIDDQFRNIAGGVKAGLQVHWFELRDVPGNFRSLRARLGLPVDVAQAAATVSKD